MAAPTRHGTVEAQLLTIVAIVVAVVSLDLLVKRLITVALGPSADAHSWWVFEGWLGFEYGRNTGAAFGLFQGNAELLAAMSVLVAGGFCWLIFNEITSRSVRIASVGLILGGAIGNLIERVWSGFVTDFVAVGPWPRFNVADSAITIGVAIFVFGMLFPANLMDGGN